MSMMACSYCGNFADTDDGEGAWEVPKIDSTRKYDFICGLCCEKYLTEDGRLNPELGERTMSNTENKSPPAHTPGPWTLINGHIVCGERGQIANVRGAGIPHNEESNANAALIAVAPELLEALAAVLADAKRRRLSLAANIIEFAQAAIAKATGAP